ncbi:hypothetical protein CRG98_041413 [Punica granatum]|uniref:Zinc knuckle CX2CX4HX4C domain-containing protein n=1 Tax=Punica granatum TaxID=22663 RepID=A0A2I0I371_PUNGR|nr:hypothetical protein CRG98_041413 [Punica granatum]
MIHVEIDRAWSVQGSHMMIAHWDKGLSLEKIKFETVTFWIQIRAIPPEMLSKPNITKLVERAGKVLEIDWKDTSSLPKWYVTSRVLVQVFFKYEYLKTFCHDCGILGHDQAHCTSETLAPLNMYGSWLRFDNQTYLLPPQVTTTPLSTPTTPSTTHYPESEPPSPTSHKGSKPKPRPNSKQRPALTKALNRTEPTLPKLNSIHWAAHTKTQLPNEAQFPTTYKLKPNAKKGLDQTEAQPYSKAHCFYSQISALTLSAGPGAKSSSKLQKLIGIHRKKL